MSEQLYAQCRLEKGTSITFSWIPKQFAVVGKVVRLKEDDGWRVTHTWETCTEQEALARERLYLKHRKGSDI